MTMECIKKVLVCVLCYCTVIKYKAYATGCPGKWRYYNGFCYLNTNYFMSYDKAQNFCDYFLDGSLPDVSDAAENKLISNLTSSKAWLGFTRCHNQQRFYWTDSEPANFTAWESGQPDNQGTDEQCVFISENGNWSDGICLERKAFVCQKSHCGENTTECYVVKTTPTVKWKEARSKCDAHQFRLAKISNSNENSAIRTLLRSRGVSQAWIGLERKNNFCSKSVSRIPQQYWDFHEPNDQNLAENCVAISSQGKWSDENCSTSLAVICTRDLDECMQKEAYGCDENSVCTNSMGSFTCSKCRDGYSRDGNSCSQTNIAAIVLGALFGASCLIIIILICYLLMKKKRWM